jgi:pyridoxamine 5'-phosphate oxidase family protein
MTFTDVEQGYLSERSLGRLASAGPDGAPQVHPVAYWIDARTGAIDIGGPALSGSQKFRNVEADPRVAFVVDDLATPQDTVGTDGQLGRGIEIRGRVDILLDATPLMEGFSNERLRIRPRRIVAWNLDAPGANARNVALGIAESGGGVRTPRPEEATAGPDARI